MKAATNTVVNGVAPDSKAHTFNAAGTFYFRAVYSGDANNTGPVNSGCAAEPIVVNPNTPSVTTTIVPAGAIAIGAAAHDTATLHNVDRKSRRVGKECRSRGKQYH